LTEGIIVEEDMGTPAFTNIRRSPSCDFQIFGGKSPNLVECGQFQKSPVVSDYNYTISEE